MRGQPRGQRGGERRRWRGVRIDEGEDLDVAAGEGQDGVVGALPLVLAAAGRLDPENLRHALGGRPEIGGGVDHVVEAHQRYSSSGTARALSNRPTPTMTRLERMGTARPNAAARAPTLMVARRPEDHTTTSPSPTRVPARPTEKATINSSPRAISCWATAPSRTTRAEGQGIRPRMDADDPLDNLEVGFSGA